MTRRVEQLAHTKKDGRVKNRNIEHLKPYQFKPGRSGNPKGINTSGKPSIIKILYKHLMRYPEEGEAIVKALIKEGQKGNIIATKEIMDRVDGKVPETHKVEGTLPITIQFVPAEIILKSETPSLPQVKREMIIEGQVREAES